MSQNTVVVPVFDDVSWREAWKRYKASAVPKIKARVSEFWLARLRDAFNAGVECGQAGEALRHLKEQPRSYADGGLGTHDTADQEW